MKAETLKKSILQYAMQGKLVAQNPDDEPASELLKRIQAEKERLIKEGKIKKEKPLPPITEDEIPYELPQGWEWVRLGEIYNFRNGLSYKKELLNIKAQNMIRVLRGGNINNLKYVFKEDDIHISEEYVKEELFLKENYLITPSVTSLEHIGKFAYIDKNYVDTVVGGFVMMFIPYSKSILSKFFLYLFSSPYVREFMRDTTNKSGQAFYNISKEKLKALCIPLPPLAEQQRIVEKLEQILPLIEEYGKNEEKLSELNKTLPDKIKQSVLQYAVQGKLVPQNPKDEPASELLKRIKAEKERLIKEGKIKKEKPLTPITEDEIPYELPQGWVWVRLGDIVYNHGQKTPDKDFCYIDIGSIDNKRQCLSAEENIIASNFAPSRARKIVKNDDIIYSTVRPYLHNMCIIDKNFTHEPIASTGFAVLTCHLGLFNKYLFYYLLSPEFDSYANNIENSKGVAYPAINDDRLYKALIPLPPLAEQKRIVGKLEELMQQIDNLRI